MPSLVAPLWPPRARAAIALVSDAMPPAAGGPDVFELQGRRITRVGNKLVDENGTLAGAAITMRDAVAITSSARRPARRRADNGDADARRACSGR